MLKLGSTVHQLAISLQPRCEAQARLVYGIDVPYHATKCGGMGYIHTERGTMGNSVESGRMSG